MVNKLRGLTAIGSGLLLVLSLWGLAYYGLPRDTPEPFLRGAVFALGIWALPWGLSRAKLVLKLTQKYIEGRRSSGFEMGTVFVSESPVADPETALERVESLVEESTAFDDVHRDAFPEGEGLTVIHTGFHNSFVRVTNSAKLAVTGASIRTRRLAREIEEEGIASLRRAFRNPFERPDPVMGASRVFLGVFIFGFVIIGIAGVAGAAYPTDAYNPAEKTVLVAIDARGSVDPGFTTNERRLAKAAFLVEVLDEKQVEILWLRNDTERILYHGRQASVISNDARSELAAVRASSPTPEQVARAERIEAELHQAEREVAAAMDRRAERQLDPEGRFAVVSERMREAANTSVRDWTEDES